MMTMAAMAMTKPTPAIALSLSLSLRFDSKPSIPTPALTIARPCLPSHLNPHTFLISHPTTKKSFGLHCRGVMNSSVLHASAHGHSDDQVSQPPAKLAPEAPFVRSVISAIVKPYLEKNPTAMAALDIIRKHNKASICYDHFAFRTFGVEGCGINSIAQLFLDMGYEEQDELRFPAKKLRALWFSPPRWSLESEGGDAVNGPLPRIFISELLVEELSPQAQAVISRYIKSGTQFSKYATTASVLNTLTWSTPSLEDYQILASESEYAAWTLVNGYALNHLTVSVHRLSSNMCKVSGLNQLLQKSGIKLNSEGGILKVSPDGNLLQSSTVADSQFFCFSGDEVKVVPASYIEFAERLVLPEYAGLPASEIKEWHRRDGFEVGNADKIFESTFSDQTGVK